MMIRDELLANNKKYLNYTPLPYPTLPPYLPRFLDWVEGQGDFDTPSPHLSQTHFRYCSRDPIERY